MWIDETNDNWECPEGPVLKLPVQLFCFDPDPSSRSEKVYLNLAREGIVEPKPVGDITDLKAALGTSLGKVIVSVTATASNQRDVLNLTKRIARLNASRYVQVQLMVVLSECNPSLPFIDALESLGCWIVWQSEGYAIEIFIRLLAWRFRKTPCVSVPCFYLHYPDSDSLEVYLLGRIQRTQLMKSSAPCLK